MGDTPRAAAGGFREGRTGRREAGSRVRPKEWEARGCTTASFEPRYRMAGIDWQDWSDDALGESRRSGRPLLLLLNASWCRFCRELEAGVLSEPDVVTAVTQRFVPVRADKDRHPEVDRRYRRGGWPTLVVVGPDGEAKEGGAALEPDEVRALVTGK